MISRVLLVTLLALPATQLTAQKVHVDFDKGTDFSRLKTYAWVRGTPANNPNMDFYIKNVVTEFLRRKGITEADFTKADSLITYHAARDADIAVAGSLDPTYAASGGVPLPNQSVWSSSPSGIPASFVRKGSLGFQILDKAANKVVWTGTAQGTLKEKVPERLDQIDKALGKLFERYPPAKN
jgi:Domain of unknown function (DUF4136)